MRNHFYILGSVFFTVYGQLTVKWQVAKAGPFPTSGAQRAAFLLRLVLNPWVLSAVCGGFLAMQCWMVALTKFELSYAYPFMSLAFVLVLILSAALFREAVTAPKLIGITLIMAGIIISSRG
jgi:multidrug transporter EmrE-like cation transporter